MSPRDIEYYRQRAAKERTHADEAASSELAEIHLELACFYEKLIELDEEPRPLLTIGEIMRPSALG